MSLPIEKMSTRQERIRKAIVRVIFDTCHEYGVICETYTRRDSNPREVNIRIDSGRIKCDFTINSMIQEPNVFVVPWVSKFEMSDAASVGGEVNPYHRQKVTKVFYTISQLVDDIDRMLTLDGSGELYLHKVG